MSSCPGCNVPYGKVPVHTLPAAKLVAYCELCHRQLTLGAKKSHVTSVSKKLSVGDTRYQIALDECDWEHFQYWGKVLT